MESMDVLLIVANNFRDEELQFTKIAVEKKGLSTQIACFTKAPRSMQGRIIKADLLLSEVKVANYKAIVFIGGIGASTYFNDETAMRIARETIEQKKILAAICIAPVILANAGLLEGKKATVWDSGSGEFISKIERKRAQFVNQSVVIDGKIITANGPSAASKFGEAIAKALSK